MRTPLVIFTAIEQTTTAERLVTLGIMGDQLRASLIPLLHDGNTVPRGLRRALNCGPPLRPMATDPVLIMRTKVMRRDKYFILRNLF